MCRSFAVVASSICTEMLLASYCSTASEEAGGVFDVAASESPREEMMHSLWRSSQYHFNPLLLGVMVKQVSLILPKLPPYAQKVKSPA